MSRLYACPVRDGLRPSRTKSPQEYNRDRIARGLCRECREPRVTSRYWRKHADKHSARQRAYRRDRTASTNRNAATLALLRACPNLRHLLP